MDIAKASNFERFVHMVHHGDGAAVAALWEQLATTGEFDLSELPEFRQLADWIVSGSSSHADRLATIGRVAVEDGVIVDPHTADGIFVGRSVGDADLPLVCLETARPTKFESTILAALGQAPPRPARLAGIEGRPQHVTVIEPTVASLRAEIESLSARWS
jgi:threonine synthase